MTEIISSMQKGCKTDDCVEKIETQIHQLTCLQKKLSEYLNEDYANRAYAITDMKTRIQHRLHALCQELHKVFENKRQAS